MRVSSANLLVASLVLTSGVRLTRAAELYAINDSNYQGGNVTSNPEGTGYASVYPSTLVVPGGSINTTTSDTPGNSASTTLASDQSGGQNLTFDMSDARIGKYGYYGESLGTVYFTPTQNVNYTISGSYQIAEDGTGGGATQLGIQVSLQNLTVDTVQGGFTTGSYLYLAGGNEDASGTANYTVAAIPQISGSLTGQLVAGKSYEFYEDTNDEVEYNDPDSGGTGVGSFAISFSPVPEPTSISLLALAGIGFMRRRRHVGM